MLFESDSDSVMEAMNMANITEEDADAAQTPNQTNTSSQKNMKVRTRNRTRTTAHTTRSIRPIVGKFKTLTDLSSDFSTSTGSSTSSSSSPSAALRATLTRGITDRGINRAEAPHPDIVDQELLDRHKYPSTPRYVRTYPYSSQDDMK